MSDVIYGKRRSGKSKLSSTLMVALRRELLRQRIAELEELPDITLGAEARKHIDNSWLWLTRGEFDMVEVICELAELAIIKQRGNQAERIADRHARFH